MCRHVTRRQSADTEALPKDMGLPYVRVGKIMSKMRWSI